MSDEFETFDLHHLATMQLRVADGEGWSQHDSTRKLANLALEAVAEIKRLKLALAQTRDEAFMGGVTAALPVIALHDDPVIWKEIVDSACDPKELRAFCERNYLLELCGFIAYDDDYRAIIGEECDDEEA